MQNVSDLYKSIVSGDYWTEVAVIVDGETYGEDKLISMETSGALFSGTPSVGGCVAGTITIEMLKPSTEFSRMAKIVPMVRVCNASEQSEWLRKGVFYIDTRQENQQEYGDNTITITGYDAIMLLEAEYGSSGMDWPATDIRVVREICGWLGVNLDTRAASIITSAYPINYPSGFTYRETLGYIGAMYGGTWVMSDAGELNLVRMSDIPPETRYLIDRSGSPITFGGVRIIV